MDGIERNVIRWDSAKSKQFVLVLGVVKNAQKLRKSIKTKNKSKIYMSKNVVTKKIVYIGFN